MNSFAQTVGFILPATFKKNLRDLPGGPVVENSSYSAGDMGSISGWMSEIPYAATKTWHSQKQIYIYIFFLI